MTGQTSGAFQLTVPPGESGAYKLSFTEPVNIQLFEDIILLTALLQEILIR